MSEQPIPNNGISHSIVGFAAGTKILTAKGHIPIEQLQLGDMVPTDPFTPTEAVFDRRPANIEVIELPPEPDRDELEDEFPWWEAN